MKEDQFNYSLAIKGYGSYAIGISESEIEEVKILKDGRKVKPKIIHSLGEYIDFIKTINSSFFDPVFYRGQVNANYLLTPKALRNNPKNENIALESFIRRFPDEIASCNNSMSKLVLMQHYNLATRCLDVSENPLVALYFACSFNKRYQINLSNGYDYWGEVLLFREQRTKDSDLEKNKRPERLKAIDSSNVSIMANTAFMDYDFSLWQLGSFWKKDSNQAYSEQYLNLKSIIRDSFIVRVPQNNLRIKNQQGACIIVNANMAYIECHEGFANELTGYIIDKDYITYENLLEVKPYKHFLEFEKPWNLLFRKVFPYYCKKGIDIFNMDPFNFGKMFYKDNEQNQVVILIPPNVKKEILKDLRLFNITEDFIYPDMDSVANEINMKIRE